MRFYFIDRITAIDPGKSILAFKNVSMAEPYFSTHFPSFPVLPGVIIIEAMAQTAGILIESSPVAGAENRKALLSIVDRVKFKKLVRPGDRLDLAARLVILDEDGARAEVSARVGDELVAETRLTFVLMDVPLEFAPLLHQERRALLMALQPAGHGGPSGPPAPGGRDSGGPAGQTR